MPAGRVYRVAAAALLSVTMAHVATTQARDTDPAKQRDEQKKVQARIEEASRRTSSTIDAMLYQRLSSSAEQKMLAEVADSLKGLSQDDIKAILDHLERAVRAPDPTTADKEQLQAYEKHRSVVAQLRGILVKLDLIRNLDEAAARLDRAANDQLSINTESLNILGRKRLKGIAAVQEDLTDKQAALGAETASVFKQIDALYSFLNPEQKERVEKADVKARGSRLVSDMTYTTRTAQQGDYENATERQRRHAKELKDLAAALRTPPASKLAALIAARDKVEKAIEKQQKVNDETAKKWEPAESPVRKPNSEAKKEHVNKLAAEQTKAEFDTRDARKAAEQVAPEVAEKLKPAETNQWKAEDKLRKDTDTKGAQEPQKKALEALKDAKDDLDQQIAQANEAKKDPLAAVKQAAEQIDDLIKEQKAAAEKTEKAEKDTAKQPAAAEAQKNVAQKADELKNTPLPPNADAKAAIEKAAEATKKAEAKLDNKKPADAKPEQKEALKNLEDAKAALEKQAQAIEQRREEIAKLEEAKKDLNKLAMAEKKVADDAKKAADEAQAGEPMKGDMPKAGEPTKGDTPKEGDSPKNGDKPKEGDSPKNGDKPKEGDSPKNGDKPKEGDSPKTGDMPKNGDKPKEGDTPKNGDKPKEGDTPKNGDKPKAGEPMKGDMPKNGDTPKMADTGELAKQQAELQPPTKDAGENLKDVAPDAAKKVDEAAKKQEAAKNDLAKNDAKAGAEKAQEAAKKLDEAAKDVDMKLAEKRGEEANDQAALKPDNVDPMAAAEQLAKAVEQANKAAEKAEEAAKALEPQPMDGKQQPKNGDKAMPPKDGEQQPKDGDKAMPPEGKQQPNLADLQKQVAKQAADLKQPEAAKAAEEAAKALEKGDLPAALEKQQKALDELNKAAAKEPMDGEKGIGEKGMPMDGEKGEKGMGEKGDKGMPMDGEKGMGEKGEKGMGEKGMGEKGMGDKGMPMNGEKGMGEKGMSGMEPMAAPTPGEVAKAQEKLIEATKAVQQSQEATNAAKAAIAQAQANAPMAVQPQLDKANEALEKAADQLGMGQPGDAEKNQMGAADALQQALDALNAAAMANGQMPTQPGQAPMANAGMPQPGMGMQPGMPQPGMGTPMAGMPQPGMGTPMAGMPQPGMGTEPNPGQPDNAAKSEADKDGPDKLKNAASSGKDQNGDGAFIHLRKRERDKVQQYAEAQFPAEFRELIKQYNINIKNNKPATAPTTPRR